jgi:hypothetical protein
LRARGILRFYFPRSLSLPRSRLIFLLLGEFAACLSFFSFASFISRSLG